MKKIIVSALLIYITVVMSAAVYAVDSCDLKFTKDTNGKFIFCNNHEFIRRKDLADTSNESARFLMNNDGLGADNYALFASHVNHTEVRNADGSQILQKGFDIELDVLFRAEENTVINLTSVGFEVPENKQYWYEGRSYTYEDEWGCFNAWSQYLGLPIRQIDSGTVYDVPKIEPTKIVINAGESVWLSSYIPNYREVPFFRPVNLLADFTIVSGKCDVNVAALKSTGTLRDRKNFKKDAMYGSYDRDRQHKGVADCLNKVETELSYTIDDWTWSDTQLPVKVYNSYKPDGNEITKWYTHLNPNADEWSYDLCAESDMLSFKYYDPNKKYFYGSGVKDKDDYWYFDMQHNDLSDYPGIRAGMKSKYSPNALVTDISQRADACNLGNFGVTESYKINITNNGKVNRYFTYRLNNSSNNVVILKDANGNLITPYAVCKGVNTTRVLDNMACVELTAQQTTSFIVEVILTTNYAGGMENSMTVTDTPNMIEVYDSSRQEIIKDYNYTGREFYKWDNGSLYLSKDTMEWNYCDLNQNVKDIFEGNWSEYEIKYTGDGYMVKAILYDGIPYYGVRDFYKTVYFLDEQFNMIGSIGFENYPTSFTAANGVYYVDAGTLYVSEDMREWKMVNSKIPCWNYGKFSARTENGIVYLSQDGTNYEQVYYSEPKPSYIDSLGNLYYYTDKNIIYLSYDGLYWQKIDAEENISSIYKTDEELVVNKTKHFKLPDYTLNEAVKVNNQYLSCNDIPFENESGWFVPLRSVCEMLGYNVEWDNGNITINYNGEHISIESGQRIITDNGTSMVSINTLAELIGCNVSIDDGVIEIK